MVTGEVALTAAMAEAVPPEVVTPAKAPPTKATTPCGQQGPASASAKEETKYCTTCGKGMRQEDYSQAISSLAKGNRQYCIQCWENEGPTNTQAPIDPPPPLTHAAPSEPPNRHAGPLRPSGMQTLAASPEGQRMPPLDQAARAAYLAGAVPGTPDVWIGVIPVRRERPVISVRVAAAETGPPHTSNAGPPVADEH